MYTIKKEINYTNCTNCKFKEYKQCTALKKRTYKQAKKEKERFSIIYQELNVVFVFLKQV